MLVHLCLYFFLFTCASVYAILPVVLLLSLLEHFKKGKTWNVLLKAPAISAYDGAVYKMTIRFDVGFV